MIIRKIRLTEYEYQPPINFVAGATEPDIQFQLTDYAIPAGAEARAYVQRFDGTFEYTVATIDGNNVTVEPTSSMFSVRGEGAIQITLYAGAEVLKNFSVPVFVHADLADENAEQGSDVTGIFRAAEEAAIEQFEADAEAKAAEVIESIPEDYTELTEEVSELNERLGYVKSGFESAVTSGYFTPVVDGSGYIDRNDGSVVASNSYIHSDYIDISGFDKLVTNSAYTGDFNAFYDSSKAFISPFSIAVGTDKTVSIPASAKYMRVSGSASKYADTNIFKTLGQVEIDVLGSDVDTLEGEVSTAQTAIGGMSDDLEAITTATAEDVGKALKAKTVTDGKVTEWEFGEAGGGGSGESIELINGYFTPPIEDTGYISREDGSVVAGGSYVHSDYIDISGYSKLTTESAYTSDFNAFYDASKVFVSAFSIAVGTDGTVAIPSNAKYMRVSTTSAKYADSNIFKHLSRDNVDKINALQDEIDAMGGDSDYFTPPIISTGYISINDGSEQANANYSRSDYIDISFFKKLITKASYDGAFNAFYTSAKAFISSFTVRTGTDNVVDVPSNAVYMRVSTTTAKYNDTYQFRPLPYVNSAKISDLDTEVDALADAIQNSDVNFAPPSVGTGNVSRDDGSIVSSSYLHSDYIDISQFPKLLTVSDYASDFNAFYKADKTFISAFSIAAGTDKIVEIPDGAMYMRVSASSSKYADTNIFRTLEYVTSDALPDYWFGNVASKCDAVRSHMNSIGKAGDTFVFATDIHWYRNQQMSPKLIRYLLNHLNINMVALGGDLITQGTKAEEIVEAVKVVKAFKFTDIFTSIAFGNHDNDSNQSDPTQRFDANTIYSLFFKGFEDSVAFMTNTEFSFYFDKTANKTRYIFLDMGDDGVSKAFTPFAEFRDALNSTPSGYKIVIVAHIIDYGTFTTSLTQMIDAYNARTTVTVNSVVCDFTSASGTILLCLGGHRHYDDALATPGGVPITVTDCDAMLSTTSQAVGTITEQCFDVVSVDYTNSLAYYERVGRGESRIVHLTAVTAPTTLTTSLTGTITWTSGNTSVATVSNGAVTKVASGTTTIKADNGSTAEIWVVK